MWCVHDSFHYIVIAWLVLLGNLTCMNWIEATWIIVIGDEATKLQRTKYGDTSSIGQTFCKVVNENTLMSSSFSYHHAQMWTSEPLPQLPTTSVESPHRHILDDLCGEKNEVIDKDNMKSLIASKWKKKLLKELVAKEIMLLNSVDGQGEKNDVKDSPKVTKNTISSKAFIWP